MNNMNEMMNKMMETMMSKMMEQMMTSMMNTMMGAMCGEPQVAEAKAEEPSPVGRRLTAEDFMDEEVDEVESTAELGAWEAYTKEGARYVWYGWADPVTGKPKFPGKQLFHVNDFYLKRDYGAYHPGKTTKYKFKNGGAKAFVQFYKVRTEVDAEDAQAFIKFMQDKEASKASKVHDTPDSYANWCNNSKVGGITRVRE